MNDIQNKDWSNTPLGPIEEWPEALYSTVIICLSSNVPICVCWGDDFQCISNDIWSALTGNKHPPPLGKPARDIFEDNWSFFETNFQEVCSTGEVKEVHNQPLSLHNGEEQNLTFSFNPIWDERGEVCGIFIIAPAENKLPNGEVIADLFENVQFKKQKRLYEAIISSTPDLVYVFDLNYRFIFANDALLEMWGLSSDEYWGKTLQEIGYEEWHAKMHEREIDQVIATKQPVQGEVSFPHAKLGERLYDYIFVPVVDETGNVEAVAGTTRDITKRNQVEEALRRGEEKYRTLFETMDDGFVILKVLFDENDNPIDFRYLETNPASDKQSGLGDRIGKKASEVLPDLEDRWIQTYGNVALTGEPVQFENYVAELQRWFEVSAYRIGEPEERKVAVLYKNITERKKSQKELKAMNETLEERVEKRTRKLRSHRKQLQSLASKLNKAEERERYRIASELHDRLGQMLAIAKMKIDGLQDGQLFDQPSSDVEELKKVVNDALKFNQNLMVELKPPPVLYKDDVTEILRWTARNVEKQGLDITFVDDGQAKPVDTEIRSVLHQSVRELLHNIIKHANTDKARIDLSRIKEQVKITVEDSGKGFDLSGDWPTPTNEGYGLFNIQERMDWHGGSFKIHSAPGEGTKAILYVPLKGESLEIAEYSDKKIPPSNKRDIQGELWQNVKVLLVDDHDMVRRGLRQMIDKQEDMTVVGEASDGREAVELAYKTFPDVVVMDVNMPVMDGIEATQKIKFKMPNLQIVGLSLHDSPEVIQDMKNAGAAAYLTKNEAFETLCETIRKVTLKP